MGLTSNPQQPLLGSEWLEAQLTNTPARSSQPRPNSQPAPSPAFCLDLSEFRRHLKRYRTLDDSLTLHLNRSSALMQSSSSPNASDASAEECARFWELLTQTWLSREHVIRSCIEVADQSVQSKLDSIASCTNSTAATTSGDDAPAETLEDSQRRRAIESEVYTDTLKKRMIHDELAIESLIRKQSMQKFRSRCTSSLFAIPPNSPPLELQTHVSSPPK
ncbi:hypothetical protein CROQUDRAFT_654583 [Cronartium quercuum f. sp. fusiforme G11]|uniref:Uncharacterized protein n=1 Tax=Cronartium quercuum f. sp. fusiforme G11 TaxID=708437 RepID=A0A9P6NKK4_9BASI|nr:hypothetical protein CROQUDRAFT_654583 [Cronartium quercuum f. sp. fusiforme G11]